MAATALILRFGVGAEAAAAQDSLRSVLDYTTFAIVLATIADTSALYVLRAREPSRPRPYRAAGYPWVPLLYILANVAIGGSMIYAQPKECLTGTLCARRRRAGLSALREGSEAGGWCRALARSMMERCARARPGRARHPARGLAPGVRAFFAHGRERDRGHHRRAVRAPRGGSGHPRDRLRGARSRAAAPTSRTITLGQGETVYGEARPPAAAGAPGGPTVIVNNQVVVSPGYGYGYGYGGGFGRGVRSDVAPAGFGATGTGSFSSSNPPGWKARAALRPRQTPGVGGNWAPPASYGPAPMR